MAHLYLASLLAVGVAQASLPLVVDVTPLAAEHGAAILRAALPELRGFVSSRDSAAECDPPATLALDLDALWRSVHLTPAAERYSVALGTDGRIELTGAGLLGLAYGIHDLREFLALSPLLLPIPAPGACLPAGAWERALAAFVARGPPQPPHYELRTYSEEGQLLALPDRGYYLPDGSGADMAAIRAEAEALEAEVVPALLRLRMNTLTVSCTATSRTT